MFSARNLLLVAHVGAAILFLGPMTVATSLFPRYLLLAAADPAELAVARAFHRISRAYGNTSLIVAVLGIALAAQGDYFDEPWVGASLVLFVVLGAVALGVIVPTQRRLLEASSGPGLGESGAAQPGLSRLRMASGLVPAVWLAILVLMVLKPS